MEFEYLFTPEGTNRFKINKSYLFAEFIPIYSEFGKEFDWKKSKKPRFVSGKTIFEQFPKSIDSIDKIIETVYEKLELQSNLLKYLKSEELFNQFKKQNLVNRNDGNQFISSLKKLFSRTSYVQNGLYSRASGILLLNRLPDVKEIDNKKRSKIDLLYLVPKELQVKVIQGEISDLESLTKHGINKKEIENEERKLNKFLSDNSNIVKEYVDFNQAYQILLKSGAIRTGQKQYTVLYGIQQILKDSDYLKSEDGKEQIKVQALVKLYKSKKSEIVKEIRRIKKTERREYQELKLSEKNKLKEPVIEKVNVELEYKLETEVEEVNVETENKPEYQVEPEVEEVSLETENKPEYQVETEVEEVNVETEIKPKYQVEQEVEEVSLEQKVEPELIPEVPQTLYLVDALSILEKKYKPKLISLERNVEHSIYDIGQLCDLSEEEIQNRISQKKEELSEYELLLEHFVSIDEIKKILKEQKICNEVEELSAMVNLIPMFLDGTKYCKLNGGSNLYKVSGLANLLNENKKQLLNGIQNYLAKKVVKKKVVKKKLKESDSDEEDVYEFEVDKELNEEFVNANIEAGFSIGGIRHNLLDKINGLELIIESKFGDPKKGDEIRTQLIELHQRLVFSVAKKYDHRGLDLEDVFQFGNIGLIEGMDKYNFEKTYKKQIERDQLKPENLNYDSYMKILKSLSEEELKLIPKISTYLISCIINKIKREILNNKSTIRVPIYIQEIKTKIDNMCNQFEFEYGRKPTDPEIIEETGLEQTDLNNVKKYLVGSTSLDGESEDKGSLIHSQEQSLFVLPEEKVESEELKNEIVKSMDVLSDREKYVVSLSFGLNGNEKFSLQKIGDKLGVTRERARQIEAKAIKRLCLGEVSKNLEEFYR